MPTTSPGPASADHLILAAAAVDYHPLPLVVAEAEGAWITDVEGPCYALAGPSAR